VSRDCLGGQVENEYGFCGSDKTYLRHLVTTAHKCASAPLDPGSSRPAADEVAVK